MAAVGQRSTTQRVSCTRWSSTGRIFSIISFIRRGGTSESSVMLWLPRTAI